MQLHVQVQMQVQVSVQDLHCRCHGYLMENVPSPSSSASSLVRGCLAGPLSNLMLSMAAEETWGQGWLG